MTKLPFDDDFQKNIEREVIRIYDNYQDKFDPNVFRNVITMDGECLNPIEYVIKDGKVHIEEAEEIIAHYKDKQDTRYICNYQLIENSLKWAHNNNLPIPDTVLYTWISDRFPFFTDNLDRFPVLVYARPVNIDLPIFPDNTFLCMTFDRKYDGKCFDWDETKKLILDNCDVSHKKKEIFYFKGTSTTSKIHQIRENLEKSSKDKLMSYLPLQISLDGWKNYQPIYKFCDYMFLLNLPGHYAWSNRQKYLYLMNSVVINIDVVVESIEPKYRDEMYKTFIDYIVDRKDHINILYTYTSANREYLNKHPEMDRKLKKMQREQFNMLIKKLIDIFRNYKNEPQKYYDMAKRAKHKVEKLTNERIYQYVYRIITLNSKYIKTSLKKGIICPKSS